MGQKEISKYFETNEKKKEITCQNLQDTGKAVFKEKGVTVNTLTKKEERGVQIHKVLV